MNMKMCTVLYAGFALGQVDDLSCGPFCLSGQTTCTCEVTGSFLSWEVKDTNGISIGQRNLQSGNLNMMLPLFGSGSGMLPFEIILTNASDGTLTALLNFNASSEYEGYMITCDTASVNLSSVPISIQGIKW